MESYVFCRPELEDERQKLVLTTSSHQRALQDTEERILHTLSTVQGNILESEEAILILQETKVCLQWVLCIRKDVRL